MSPVRFGLPLCAALFLATCSLSAQTADPTLVITPPPHGDPIVDILWPKGAPGAVGKTEADIPKLYCYAATGPGPHTAVVILPGGGYTHLVMGKEGAFEADWLNQHNISACVLQYRLGPRYLYPWALLDGLRAVREVRAHAKDWGINPDAIGVWGFSAGGHMAGYLATAPPHGVPEGFGKLTTGTISMDAIDQEISARPDFAIINYGRVVLSVPQGKSPVLATLIGDHPSQALIDYVDPILHVTKDTSPTFLYATERDEKVDSTNATLFYNALQKAGVPAELHVFEQGPHGTHMGTDQPKFPELAVYPILLEHWLQLHGWLPPTP
ncbi:MAG: alpha/beta hydrolase [Acidobacteriota bacterium]